jgi:hypothetical protein
MAARPRLRQPSRAVAQHALRGAPIALTPAAVPARPPVREPGGDAGAALNARGGRGRAPAR